MQFVFDRVKGRCKKPAFFRNMKVTIPYKQVHTPELKYCLRGIEKFIDKPEVIIIGDLPHWIKNVTHIPYPNSRELRFKERNIYEKIMQVCDDFLFFNDDHYLLQPYEENYHYSGTLSQTSKALSNSFSKTIQNTIDLLGDIKSYFRHNPMFIKNEILKTINVDWNKEWGYCIKSIYCHEAGIEGIEYPDLKIRICQGTNAIKKLIVGRPYFSTGNNSIDTAMINVLNELYPFKSVYE